MSDYGVRTVYAPGKAIPRCGFVYLVFLCIVEVGVAQPRLAFADRGFGETAFRGVGFKFVGAERVVRLEGEAYFEVAKDDEQPFVVTFGDQKVKVLGTHFNITAYDEGVQRTTLIEGKVQVERGGETMMLSPNEQVTMVGGKMRKKSIDASEYIAWKEGYFVFHNATPNEIMQQLTYWYDLM